MNKDDIIKLRIKDDDDLLIVGNILLKNKYKIWMTREKINNIYYNFINIEKRSFTI